MNLCITNLCNRRCEYCFQKNWFLANSKEEFREMSLDIIEKIFLWNKDNNLKILGGEPLLYSKLNELFELAKKHNKKITIISNISINPQKFKEIIDKYSENPIVSFLINTDYPNYQQDIFFTNLQYLIKNKKISFALSTTLLPNKDKIKESQNRLAKILKKCKFYQRNIELRISPAEPYNSLTYKTYDYTLDVYNLYLKLNRIRPGICIHFDCPVNACEINSIFFIKKDVNIAYDDGKCYNGMPFDILPDGSAIWCSSLRNFKIDNIFNYSNIDECIKELQNQYNKYWKTHKLLCNYRNCGKYDQCQGLCAAKNISINNGNFN